MMKGAILVQFLLIICCVTSEVLFGEVKTLLTLSDTFPSLNETPILAIEPSSREPSTFFLSANTSILLARLWPKNEQRLELIAGNLTEYGYREGTEALFYQVSNLEEIDEGLIVIDSANYCLRLIQPPSTQSTKWSTSTYAGKCQKFGFQDGKLLDADFAYPVGSTRQGDFLFIADLGSKRLRRLDMNLEEVITIHQSYVYGPIDPVLSQTEDEFYVTVSHGILKIREGRESWLVGWSTEGFQQVKTPFSTAEFTDPRTLIWLDDDILVLTNNVNKIFSIRVVDISKQEVDVICPATGDGIRDGHSSRCALDTAYGLYAINNTLVIGDKNSIRSVEYQIIKEAPATDGTLTSTTQNSPTSCQKPAIVPHAYYELLESYPEGSTVYYQCTDNYVRRTGINNRQVCTDVNGELTWVGAQIECQLTQQTISASVLAAICICTMIAIVMTAVKIRSINKRLEEATSRQTQVPMTTIAVTTAGPSAGCSSKTLRSETGSYYSLYRGPDQPISTSSTVSAPVKRNRTLPQIPSQHRQ